MRKQIQKLIELNIIKIYNSPYNSPLWIVPKKPDANGNLQWRMVIDFMALNAKTVGDAHPLPNFTEILKRALATFQRLMDRILTGFQGTKLFVYLDDIVIFVPSIEDHTGRARRVFSGLAAAGPRLQPEKCVFLSTKIKYLRHIISDDGVRPDPNKICAVKNFLFQKLLKT